MTLFTSIIDNIGDVLGTSKLARLNRTLFEPVLGTSITRAEYNMCRIKDNMMPDRQISEIIQAQGRNERKQFVGKLLNLMVDNGTVFSERRIFALAASTQTNPGISNLPYKVEKQLSSNGQRRLHAEMRTQRRLSGIPSL